MALVNAGPKYTHYLKLYTKLSGKQPTYLERTQAFLAVNEGRRPWWARYSKED